VAGCRPPARRHAGQKRTGSPILARSTRTTTSLWSGGLEPAELSRLFGGLKPAAPQVRPPERPAAEAAAAPQETPSSVLVERRPLRAPGSRAGQSPFSTFSAALRGCCGRAE
jgi:hypothetical protein